MKIGEKIKLIKSLKAEKCFSMVYNYNDTIMFICFVYHVASMVDKLSSFHTMKHSTKSLN